MAAYIFWAEPSIPRFLALFNVVSAAVVGALLRVLVEIIQWFEERKTAAKTGRPEFTRMLKLLRARKAQGVVIHKIDRSTRNY